MFVTFKLVLHSENNKITIFCNENIARKNIVEIKMGLTDFHCS